MPRTLIVTNDFPPRIGGIESFVAEVCRLLDDDVVVYASGPPGAADTDRDRGYPVVRDHGLLLPTPRVARRAAELLRAYGADRVLFGAAAPLGLLAPSLRRAGAETIVGLTHGHEIWWAGVPGARSLLRRIGDGCDHLTTISDFTAGAIATALSPSAGARLLRLAPPVDTGRFRPGAAPASPGCVAVGRFVAQKGFVDLLQSWSRVVKARPGVRLTLVGDGPQRAQLERWVDRWGLSASVEFTGALPREAVIERLQQATVFALPMRTRWRGLNPEGLGLAALEAAACGLPVLVGASGGAPETVRDGVTGRVLDPRDHAAWACEMGRLLDDPAAARVMGERGRAYVEERFGDGAARRTLRGALGL